MLFKQAMIQFLSLKRVNGIDSIKLLDKVIIYQQQNEQLYPAQEHLLLQCSYDDKYDFNASTHRGIIGESLTRLGAMFSGKEYQILLPGEIHIKESGKREYKGRDSGLFMQPL